MIDVSSNDLMLLSDSLSTCEIYLAYIHDDLNIITGIALLVIAFWFARSINAKVTKRR